LGASPLNTPPNASLCLEFRAYFAWAANHLGRQQESSLPDLPSEGLAAI